MVISKLLDLPNELLLDVFQYLHAGQLFYSLYGLTIRLNALLKRCHPYHLRLDTIENLNLVCQCLEPKQIHSLAVPSSNQIILFDQLFKTPQFVQNCQALFLYDIEPYDFIFLVRRLSQFQKLASLSIIRKSVVSFETIYNEILTEIICNRMQALKYFKLIVPRRASFDSRRLQAVTSTYTLNNLEHLVLNNSTIKELFSLLSYLPSLTSIDIHSLTNGQPDSLSKKTKIINLKIIIKQRSGVTFGNLAALLSEMPQLRTFSLKAFGDDFVDGDKWENVIEKNLPFLMKFRFEFRLYKATGIDEILATFQTDFWSKLKNWSVKGDYEKGDHEKGIKPSIRIYTLT